MAVKQLRLDVFYHQFSTYQQQKNQQHT